MSNYVIHYVEKYSTIVFVSFLEMGSFLALAKVLALIMLVFIIICISLQLDAAEEIDYLAYNKLYKRSLYGNADRVVPPDPWKP